MALSILYKVANRARPAYLDILSILPELLRLAGVVNICALGCRATRKQRNTATGRTSRLLWIGPRAVSDVWRPKGNNILAGMQERSTAAEPA
jgi:hypothetical protein